MELLMPPRKLGFCRNKKSGDSYILSIGYLMFFLKTCSNPTQVITSDLFLKNLFLSPLHHPGYVPFSGDGKRMLLMNTLRTRRFYYHAATFL